MRPVHRRGAVPDSEDRILEEVSQKEGRAYRYSDIDSGSAQPDGDAFQASGPATDSSYQNRIKTDPIEF
jgi:hypothetical protein